MEVLAQLNQEFRTSLISIRMLDSAFEGTYVIHQAMGEEQPEDVEVDLGRVPKL